MNVVILASRFGTRLTEASAVRPKPMVEIGGKPILWHIMKISSAHGIDDFVICCGYKGDVIKDFFADYFLHMSDVRFDLKTQTMTKLRDSAIESWTVTLIDTGEATMTGGRLKRVAEYIGDGTFCLTYRDCVRRHRHRRPGRIPPRPGRPRHADRNPAARALRRSRARDGGDEDQAFKENRLGARAAQASGRRWEGAASKHRGYWQSMDTLRGKAVLEAGWATGKPLWKVR